MFDRFVSGTRPSWSRRGVLVASLAMHGVVGLALLVASFFHVAEIAPPALAIVFVSAPPPPPGGNEGAVRPKAQHAKPRPRVQPIRVATVQPQPTPPPADEPASAAPDGNDGDGGGSGGGPGGPGIGPGVPGGTGAGPIASLPPPKPMNVPPHKLDAQRIAGDDPHLPFPMIKAHAGERGLSFIARLCVEQSGRVSSVSVVQSLPGADESIVDVLRRWRYKPQPIPVCFMSNFVFDVDAAR